MQFKRKREERLASSKAAMNEEKRNGQKSSSFRSRLTKFFSCSSTQRHHDWDNKDRNNYNLEGGDNEEEKYIVSETVRISISSEDGGEEKKSCIPSPSHIFLLPASPPYHRLKPGRGCNMDMVMLDEEEEKEEKKEHPSNTYLLPPSPPPHHFSDARPVRPVEREEEQKEGVQNQSSSLSPSRCERLLKPDELKVSANPQSSVSEALSVPRPTDCEQEEKREIRAQTTSSFISVEKGSPSQDTSGLHLTPPPFSPHLFSVARSVEVKEEEKKVKIEEPRPPTSTQPRLSTSHTEEPTQIEVIGVLPQRHYGKHINLVHAVEVPSGRSVLMKSVVSSSDLLHQLHISAKRYGERYTEDCFESYQEAILTIEREVHVLSHLGHHDHILKLLGYDRDEEGAPVALLEYTSEFTLSNLSTVRGPSEWSLRAYLRQVTLALKHCHDHGVVYLNLCGENVVLFPSEGHVKLTNFGSSVFYGPEASYHMSQSSDRNINIYWSSPERLASLNNSNNENVTYKPLPSCDVWSLGCLLIELTTSHHPWFGNHWTHEEAVYRIALSRSGPYIPKHLSKDARDFARLCFTFDPLHRPSVDELLSHPFLSSHSE